VQNINTTRGNVILGEECITLYGEGYIVDRLGDFKFKISPLSFYQVNPVQTEALYNVALDYADLTGEETVFDLYSGIGTISIFAASKAKKVYGVEIVEPAVEDAKLNAEMNEVKNAEFIVGEAEKVIPEMYKQGITADVVFVDPPRKGCGEELLQTIKEMKPKKVVYVSCNPATLGRDLRYLSDNGFEIKEVQPVDMFCQSHHVENVVLLCRK
jgi:23S rRNA (uracil1939-C5)-methyltransferase